MSIFGMMMLFFVFSRVMGRRRGYWQRYSIPLRGPVELPVAVPAPVTIPRENAFEALKRRYVNGELSDERYQDELDSLLKTPEGRSQIQ